MSRQRTIDILFLTLIGLGLLQQTPAQAFNDDIRGSLQSLIRSYQMLDNKLERHEHRERALGELMKKAMQSLQKGQKSLEPLNGIFGRLDERVSQIETMLITQEEKYNSQAEKFSQTLANIFKWMRDNDECFRRPPGMPGSGAPTALAPTTAGVPNEFVEQQKQVNKDLLAEIKSLSSNVAKLLTNSQDLMAQSDVTVKSLPNTANILTKIEDKLVSYSVAPVTVAPVDNSEFEHKVLKKFGELSTNLEALNASPKPSAGLSNVDKEFIHGLANDTLSAMAAYTAEALSATESALTKVKDQVQQSEANLGNNLKQVDTEVADTAQLLNKFYKEMNSSYSKLNDGLEIFDKFNNIMMTNSEYVLDTQRKVDFATLQIVQKISNLFDKKDEELRTLLKERFDNVDEGVINTSLESTKNLSTLLDTELGQVWHRIEIMTGELTDSTELLKLMQSGHEGFINSSFSTMTTLAGKVDDTKTRMLDMDENLNYLLGKLTLMSDEFRRIKAGLAESLEELRNSFHMMQERIPTSGSENSAQNGEKNKYFTDLNLLSKRHTETTT